jgi:hypothetical protein
VKGDIDGEIDAGAMREDWEQVQALAAELGDKKWQYRALAQLGIAAFYNNDLKTAGANVAKALVAATASDPVLQKDGTRPPARRSGIVRPWFYWRVSSAHASALKKPEGVRSASQVSLF